MYIYIYICVCVLHGIIIYMHIFQVVVAACMHVAISVGCSNFATISLCSNVLPVLVVVAACMHVANCCFLLKAQKT